jgi:prolyl-tRNA synthetase
MSVRRDNGVKGALPIADLSSSVPALLDQIHHDMLNRARETFDKSIVKVEEWEKLVPALNGNNIVVIPWCEAEKCEDEIKDRSAKECVPPRRLPLAS